METERRIINFRPLFLIGVGFFFGILLARDLFTPKWLVLCVVFLALAGAVVFSCLKKRIRQMLCFVCAFIVGVGVFFSALAIFQPKEVSGEVQIQGRVVSVEKDEGSYQVLILKNVMINGDRKNKRISLFVSGASSNFETGDNISFASKLQRIQPFNLEEFSTQYYKKNVGWTTTAASLDITTISNNKNFIEKFQDNVKKLLFNNMTDESASVSYAVIFGDKTDIPSDTKEAMSSVGIAHLLAVSGLHIGFLTLVLCWILKKLHANRFVTLCVVSVLLIFYCVLCSFTPSVVRASIMAIVFIVSKTFGKEYDSLSSLSFAAIVILIFRPLYVFDLGFLMSFMSIVSILMISPLLEKVFKKIRFPSFLSKTISVTLAVQIGVLPLMAKFVPTTSLFSVFANLVCIPIFEIGFCFLILTVPFALMFKFFDFLLWVPDFCIHTISLFAKSVILVPSSNLSIKYISKYFVICFAIAIYLFSKFVCMETKYKFMVLSLLAFIYCSLELSILSRQRFASLSIGSVSLYDANAYIVSDLNREKHLIVEGNNLGKNQEKIKKYLNYFKISKINSILLLNSNLDKQLIYNYFSDYDVNDVISYGAGYNEFHSYQIYPVGDNNNIISLSCGSTKMIFLSKNISNTSLTNLEYLSSSTNSRFVFGLPDNLENEFSNYYVLTNSQLTEKRNFTFSLADDKISKVRCVD